MRNLENVPRGTPLQPATHDSPVSLFRVKHIDDAASSQLDRGTARRVIWFAYGRILSIADHASGPSVFHVEQ
jgi:hypothetical protein